MLGDWESFCFEIAHDPALQKAVEPDREAVAVEDEWTRFKEGLELRAAGGEPLSMHPPRPRSQHDEQPGDERLIRHAKQVLAGRSVDELAKSIGATSPETAERLRELGRLGRI